MTQQHYFLAREGWPFIAISLLAAILVTVFVHPWWGAPLWLIAIFVIQFFRDPQRVSPTEAHLILSPADGKVVCVEPGKDPYLDRDCIKISVFMNVFSVHSNRSPVAGEVLDSWYTPGSFVNAALDKASEHNERQAIHLRSSYNGNPEIVCVQVAGLIARRILCYVKKADQLTAGQRYGFIRFGSRVDLYLPTSVAAKVAVGDWVTAGKSTLAHFPTAP